MATNPPHLTTVSTPAPSVLRVGFAHNNYKLYVKDPNDIVGRVAYSIYKQHKISFLEKELATTGQAATQAKIDTFCDLYGNPQQVELLQQEAGRYLAGLNSELLRDTVKKIQVDYDKKLVKELKESGGIWRAIRYSIAGNIATGILIAGVMFTTTSSFDQLLDKALSYFKDKPETSTLAATPE